MSDKLSNLLWVQPKAEPAPPEDRVKEALRKALDSTTPERAGVPWDEAEEVHEQQGWTIPGTESEEI